MGIYHPHLLTIAVYQVLTETDIIRGCIKNDTYCQHLLFEQYAGRLMSVCLRYSRDSMEAEDISQEAFIRIFKYIHQYRFEGSLEGWMRRVVVSTALKHVQKRKIRFSEMHEEYDSRPALQADALSAMSADEIFRLINSLPEGYRLVFNLSVMEGYSHDEIAQMLNIQAVTSRTQLVKARKMLQNKIVQLQKVPAHDGQ